MDTHIYIYIYSDYTCEYSEYIYEMNEMKYSEYIYM